MSTCGLGFGSEAPTSVRESGQGRNGACDDDNYGPQVPRDSTEDTSRPGLGILCTYEYIAASKRSIERVGSLERVD